MTRPKNGCLKILACAGAGSDDPSAGSDAEADGHHDENKAISDKSRWSFRKRSTRHRVLKNSDISEPETLSSSKAKAEIAPSNIYSSTYPYASEKPLHQEKPDEKIPHQEKPDEKIPQQEKPDEKIPQQEKPDEKILQQEKPDEKPLHGEMLDKKLTEKPIEQPTEKVTEVPCQDPAEKIAENPIVEPNEKDVEEYSEKPDGSIFISSAEVTQDETVSLFDTSSAADHQKDHVESSAVIIQSGIRTYIEQHKPSNHQDIVKLQAVIRGHLVRRQAAESLQCLLAIVKMQGLVRAHQAQQYGGKFQDTLICSSSQKLLHNGFTLKLMDSMSSSKSFHIKCDPLKSDGAWNWMEMWTTMIPPNTVGHLLGNGKSRELIAEEVQEESRHEEKTIPLDSDISFPKLALDDVEETIRTTDSCALEASACIPDRTPGMETEDSQPESIQEINADVEKLSDPKMENVIRSIRDTSDPKLENVIRIMCDTLREPVLLPEKPESSNEKTGDDSQPELIQEIDADAEKLSGPKMENAIRSVHDTSREPVLIPEKPESSYEDTMDAYKTEQTLEMEGKRFMTRKSSNPAFATALMKFEELTSNSIVSRSNSSSYLDGASTSKGNTQDNASTKQISDTSIPDSSVGHDPKTVPAASECGTEISISSTLDSPDRSEADGGEIVLEIGALEDRNHVADNAGKNTCVLHSEANTTGEVVQPEKEEQNANSANPVVVIDSVPVEKLDLHDQLERSIESYAKSPEGTPMSQTTFAESHGTPSSEVSINTKKSKSKRPKSHVSKRSLTSPRSDFVERSSTDNMSNDYKLSKRESSGKGAKSDHVDQEPRMSNSTPLPSYMQFTESARAKASASISPKLSLDVQDNNPRKRHSLPMTNGKQDSSPRMQRSSSQAQQNVKSSGAVPHNSSDRRWHK
ncbi:hypothetical protein GUJ93_ZPchr0458g22295 [Zizania palustris]|uniref:DUF4005 domain-containing protein n=1 Tax=Zizania palustris TaxID=103762 RepID=A0A8J5VF62_ZIZPA|nr:hypothetical protein GUJ93_ZPchr0458g22295 [Zizania palustris]